MPDQSAAQQAPAMFDNRAVGAIRLICSRSFAWRESSGRQNGFFLDFVRRFFDVEDVAAGEFAVDVNIGAVVSSRPNAVRRSIEIHLILRSVGRETDVDAFGFGLQSGGFDGD